MRAIMFLTIALLLVGAAPASALPTAEEVVAAATSEAEAWRAYAEYVAAGGEPCPNPPNCNSDG